MHGGDGGTGADQSSEASRLGAPGWGDADLNLHAAGAMP
jgi:hypothetical protein